MENTPLTYEAGRLPLELGRRNLEIILIEKE